MTEKPLRFFVSRYTDGPEMRYNIIDRTTQEWVVRLSTEELAKQECDRRNLQEANRLGRIREACEQEFAKRALDLEQQEDHYNFTVAVIDRLTRRVGQ